ncbi:MAG: ABC transporter ATP-binding protein [Acidobacteria bacterium]|nr:ABC transporter ATP-binding protein [Acidobacteriota bacterium]
MEPLRLVLSGAGHRYPGADVETPSNVSAVIERGEKALLVGPVGSGKTTLLLLIAGLRRGSGRVVLGGDECHAAASGRARPGVGFLWQNPDDGLFLPGVLEDVALGPVNDGIPAASALEKARASLESVGAGHLEGREVAKLSRGEKQLVALAGILARDPGLLLLDEPLSALDAHARKTVLSVLAGHPATVLLATHHGIPALEAAGFKTAITLPARRLLSATAPG